MKSAALDQETTGQLPRAIDWLPLIALPLASYGVASNLPPWQLMWVLLISVYAGAKWLTFANCPAAWEATLGRVLAYALL